MIIKSNWRRTDKEKPQTDGITSKSLFIIYKHQLHVGHFHCNGCFYVSDGRSHYNYLLGSIKEHPDQAPFSGFIPNKINPSEVYWTPQNEVEIQLPLNDMRES